ncbi:MAG: hypothetical protein WCM93_09710, partial [Bacteroidota bacterium]
MIKGKHGKDDKSFEQLNFSEQAKSINGQISRLTRSIIAHRNRAQDEINKNPDEVLLKCAGQIGRIRYNVTK